ncbi:ribonuclease HII [Alkalibacterium sp. AK22]|uniref:ribonuclease HII n=1 Tax=Alkalibacterium sp. AK22 TaxID=1229520 RepID=UPI000554ED70
MQQTIKEIRQTLNSDQPVEATYINQLRSDERAGVKAALKSWEKQQAKAAYLREKFEEMQQYEHRARKQGASLIAGIDEVGRGPLAGPVVSAAVMLPEDIELIGINDSKQLSLKDRVKWFDVITEKALAVSVSVVSAEVIDQLNIYQATRLSMKEAIANLTYAPDHILVDAMHIDTSISQEKIIKGDAKSISIAAASIIAKVTRDRLMEDYDRQFPGYGFSRNVGYGTKEHLAGLEKYGPSPIHRFSFSPVSDFKKN